MELRESQSLRGSWHIDSILTTSTCVVNTINSKKAGNARAAGSRSFSNCTGHYYLLIPAMSAPAGDPTDALAHHENENPVVFLDVSIGGAAAGRITLELFADVVPRTAENFRQFCTGELRRNGVPVGYKGAPFHRVMRDFMVQGGDILHGDGTGCTSIYGGRFEDENFALRHSGPGVLSVANSGPNENGCQFFITCTRCDFLDGKHVVFGKVTSQAGMAVLRKLENVAADGNGKPSVACVVTECGQM